MLRKQPWFDFCDALEIEVEQSTDEGRDAAHYAAQAGQVQGE